MRPRRRQRGNREVVNLSGDLVRWDSGESGIGAPQPASGPMVRATALWYVDFTDGQLQMFERDGDWYLYLPGDPATIQPDPQPGAGGD
jgi:hypothetical protein